MLFTRSLFTPKRSFSQPRLFSTDASAISFQSYGNPQRVLRLNKETLSDPKENEVQIKILSSPVHKMDLAKIQGFQGEKKDNFPAVGGSEGVGVVLKVGTKVNSLKPKDKVVAVPSSFGTWRTHAVVKENDLIKVDSSLQNEQAATLSIGPMTASRLLEDFQTLKAGDVIIQNGASGLVAQSVIQLAARKGVKTINIISNRPNQEDLIERLKKIGAHLVVNENFARTYEFRRVLSDLPPPSLGLNAVGGQSALEIARVLREGSTLVTYSGAPRQPLQLPSSLFITKDLRLRGFSLKRWSDAHPQEHQQMLRALEQLVLKDQLKIWVEKHRLENFQEALARSLESDRKVVFSFE